MRDILYWEMSSRCFPLKLSQKYIVHVQKSRELSDFILNSCYWSKNWLFEADIPTSISNLNENFANMSIMVIMKQEVQSVLTFLKYRMELVPFMAALCSKYSKT